jgi:hypothetical protein
MTVAAPKPQTAWSDGDTLTVVRPEVRKVLAATPAFARLSPTEQKEIASTMVKIASYMANPDGLTAKQLAENVVNPPRPALVRAQAEPEDPATATKRRLSEKPGFAGKDFEAGGVKQGVQQFGELVKKVDFPKFVGGLIKNVFQAIVESSIEQMRAYGELLANVAKTVDQFAQDNITENNARDWIAGRFPDLVDIERTDSSTGFAEDADAPAPQARVVPKGEDPAAVAKTISDSMQLEKPITDLSDEAEERRLVLAARLQIARSRQQLLASMVMLGINRIVITDGLIHAKVVFDMRAGDTAGRKARASMLDTEQQHFGMKTETSYGGWFSPVDASLSSEYSNDHMSTVQSSIDETSESKAEVKAKLSGEVRVNFKSDYFPMDKLASPEMIAAIQGNAKPAEKPAVVA